MIFLCAQDSASYFLWQTYVFVKNLNIKNTSKKNNHVLFATRKEQQIRFVHHFRHKNVNKSNKTVDEKFYVNCFSNIII